MTPNPQGDQFKIELDRIVNPTYSLVQLGQLVDWDRLDELFGKTCCENNGRPAISTRVMIALHYLKLYLQPQ